MADGTSRAVLVTGCSSGIGRATALRLAGGRPALRRLPRRGGKADAQTDESFLAGEAEAVAKAMERALRARRPRSRYRVATVSRPLPALHGLLPDRGWDAFLRTQAPPPRPGG